MDARNSRRFTCGWRLGSRLYFGAGLVCERENRQGDETLGQAALHQTRASAAGTPAVIAKARSAVNDSQKKALSAWWISVARQSGWNRLFRYRWPDAVVRHQVECIRRSWLIGLSELLGITSINIDMRI